MTEKRTRVETFKLEGSAVVDTVRRLLHEGNVRRISVKNERGEMVFDMPLTLGVVAAVFLPLLSALAAAAALASRMTIVVEKEIEAPDVSEATEDVDVTMSADE